MTPDTAAPPGGPATAEELEAAARLLEASPQYRVLRRLVPRDQFGLQPAGNVLRAAIVDTETTGTDPASDRIIELCVLVFDYCEDGGQVLAVRQVYDGLEDPGRPIPPQATAIHGITDDMVAGQRLDDAALGAMLQGVSWIIAHNAGFDRPLLERRLPVFAQLRWLCSMKEVPWEQLGFPGTKLEYLATARGFFYDAHRSEVDCRAVLELLRQPLARDGSLPMQRLLTAGQRVSYRIYALGSPFETKDLMKARGYRWDGERRSWWIEVDHDEAAAEAQWLREQVYGGRSRKVEVEILDAGTRYAARRGKVIYRDL